MPTVSPKRVVRYSAADIAALTNAITILEFMQDFDTSSRDIAVHTETVDGLRAAAKWINAQRNGKPAESKPAEPAK